MDFTKYLKEQFGLHPSMLAQDAVKQCYQAAFGAEHLLTDIEAARKYFDDEFLATPESDNALYERISHDFCRVNLCAWKKRGLPSDWLFEGFRITALFGAPTNSTSADIFSNCLKDVEALTQRGEAPFTTEDWRDFLAQYNKGGIRPIHHSSSFRSSERPAYRIVSTQLVQLIPLLLYYSAR